ncbi:MAG: hypothetical protein NTX56_19350 [Proteobacteria bacterium]|nr:hypothetical protein [Pseudomonadota bacterium]
MLTTSKVRIGKFTRTMIAFGVVAGILIGLRPIIPRQMRYEIDDFFRRPFIPHYIVPIQTLKPVPQQQVVDELDARGFDVRCYGNLPPSQQITSKDDYHCWTTLSSAFDHIPARDLRLWFQKGTLVHVRFEFPSGELSRIHAYLERVLDPSAAQHLKAGNKLGVDNIGHPIMSWYTPDGSITVNSQETPNERNIVLWSSWAANATGLNGSDTGTYTVVQRAGQLTDLAFYMALSGKTWSIEDRKPDGSWSAMDCTKDCALRVSSPGDIARFFPLNALASIVPSCVHNGALAFCTVAARLSPERKTHILITLLTPVPIPLPTKKVSDERSFPALDGARPQILPSPMSINPRQRT